MNYLTHLQINKNGVATDIQQPSTNGRVKFVDGIPIVKQAIPWNTISDTTYTAQVTGENIIYGLANVKDGKTGTGHITITLNDTKIYDVYCGLIANNDFLIVCPVIGSGMVKIQWSGIKLNVDQLQILTFL